MLLRHSILAKVRLRRRRRRPSSAQNAPQCAMLAGRAQIARGCEDGTVAEFESSKRLAAFPCKMKRCRQASTLRYGCRAAVGTRESVAVGVRAKTPAATRGTAPELRRHRKRNAHGGAFCDCGLPLRR